MPELTLDDPYTGPNWWENLESIDGVPPALERDPETVPSPEGEQELAALAQRLLDQYEANGGQAGFMATLVAKKPPCKRVLLRGIVVCSHSVPKLTAWFKATGDNVLIWPLAGCGAYQTSTVASAGTHAGGGAGDYNANPHSPAERVMVMRKAREVGLHVGWFRAARKGVWTNHYHILDPDCPQLAHVAANQCVECFNGGDGLVGSARDDGWRGNIGQLQSIFANRFVSAVADIAAGVGKIGAAVVGSKVDRNVADIPVRLGGPIREANLRKGKRNSDVARYQAALWNRLPTPVRIEFMGRYGLKRADLYDGIYGNVTAAMTSRLYTLIRLPAATEPGPKMISWVGFRRI